MEMVVRLRLRLRLRSRGRGRARVRGCLPQLVDGASDGRRVGAHVVALVLLHVAVVGVRALEQQVADELAHGLLAVHESEARLERVIVHAAVAVENLQGGEVR